MTHTNTNTYKGSDLLSEVESITERVHLGGPGRRANNNNNNNN